MPCGDLREVDEVSNLFAYKEDVNYAVVNLWGHGCLIMMNEVLNNRELELIPRPLPEGQ